MRWLKSCFPDPAGDDAFSRLHWGKLAWFSFAFFWLNVLFLRYLDVFNFPAYLWAAGREDGPIENLTALLLFLAALLLLTAARGRGRFLRGMGLLGGLALLFVAGEEINWGQRIFGFAAPDFMGGVNAQANIHNLPGLNWRIEKVFRQGISALLLLGTAAFVLRKKDLAGWPLPALPLLLTLPILFDWPYDPIGGVIDWTVRGPVDLIFKRAGLFLLFILIWAGWAREGRPLIAAAATLICLLALANVGYHYALGHTPHHTEGREYLFSLAALLYALQVARLNPALGRRLAAVGSRVKSGWSRWAPRPLIRGRQLSGQRFFEQRFSGQHSNGLPRAGGRWVWLTAGLLLTGGSLLLLPAHWQFADPNLRYYQSVYSSIQFGLWGPPAAQAKFDLYLKHDSLAYIREPCRPEDVADPFLAHFIPADPGDLPPVQRPNGFHNRDFGFHDRARWLPDLRPGRRTGADLSTYRRGLVFDGKCVALATLPDYPLAAIRTGQYRSDGSQTWVVELAVGP